MSPLVVEWVCSDDFDRMLWARLGGRTRAAERDGPGRRPSGYEGEVVTARANRQLVRDEVRGDVVAGGEPHRDQIHPGRSAKLRRARARDHDLRPLRVGQLSGRRAAERDAREVALMAAGLDARVPPLPSQRDVLSRSAEDRLRPSAPVTCSRIGVVTRIVMLPLPVGAGVGANHRVSVDVGVHDRSRGAERRRACKRPDVHYSGQGGDRGRNVATFEDELERARRSSGDHRDPREEHAAEPGEKKE